MNPPATTEGVVNIGSTRPMRAFAKVIIKMMRGASRGGVLPARIQSSWFDPTGFLVLHESLLFPPTLGNG